MRDRAWRRHQKQLTRRKAANIAKKWSGIFDDPEFAKQQVDFAVKNADHLKSCSCDSCCNPRRSEWVKEKRTWQEIQADLKLKENVDD